MIPTWKALLLPAFLACPVLAEWPTIPPEVWAIKEDPSKGIKDAVVLEERTIFKNTYVEYVKRVRILSNAGRRAAEFNAFSEDCYGFDGRTVYPDGKQLKFDKRQDFKEDSSEIGDFKSKRTFAVPPGVTDNCVVELRWLESTAEFYGRRLPLPARVGYELHFSLGSNYRTLLETVEIPVSFPWTFSAISGRTQKLTMEERSGFRIYSAKDLPAQEQPPFSLSVSLDCPVFSIFYQPDQLQGQVRQPLKDYWNAVGKMLGKEDFDSEIRKGRYYDQFRQKVFSHAPMTNLHALGAHLIKELEKEIVNSSRLTREESAMWPKDRKTPRSGDLGAICEQKVTEGRGMVVLLYHLLKDAGFRPKIALLADRDQRLLRPSLLNPWQATHAVVALELEGKGTLLLDPSIRFAAPGLIHPDYQGVQALMLDPHSKWNSEFFTVPIQPAAANQKKFDISLEIGDEEDRFKVSGTFSGFPELAERRRYDEDEQKERDRSLKERFEKDIKGASVQRAEVKNANNPDENVGWVVEGQVEREGGRQRHVVPFLGVKYPLNIPDAMPMERSLPIVMPYLQTQIARSTFKVPKGYRVHAGQPFQQRNSFGTVAWVVEQKKEGNDDVVITSMKVTVDTMFAAPSSYEDLRTFLGWITESFRRTIILEKA